MSMRFCLDLSMTVPSEYALLVGLKPQPLLNILCRTSAEIPY